MVGSDSSQLDLRLGKGFGLQAELAELVLWLPKVSDSVTPLIIPIKESDAPYIHSASPCLLLTGLHRSKSLQAGTKLEILFEVRISGKGLGLAAQGLCCYFWLLLDPITGVSGQTWVP